MKFLLKEEFKTLKFNNLVGRWGVKHLSND